MSYITGKNLYIPIPQHKTMHKKEKIIFQYSHKLSGTELIRMDMFVMLCKMESLKYLVFAKICFVVYFNKISKLLVSENNIQYIINRSIELYHFKVKPSKERKINK